MTSAGPQDADAGWRAAVLARDVAAASEQVHREYALVLVDTAPAHVDRDQWMRMLPDYVVHDWRVRNEAWDVIGDVAVLVHLVDMQADVLEGSILSAGTEPTLIAIGHADYHAEHVGHTSWPTSRVAAPTSSCRLCWSTWRGMSLADLVGGIVDVMDAGRELPEEASEGATEAFPVVADAETSQMPRSWMPLLQDALVVPDSLRQRGDEDRTWKIAVGVVVLALIHG